MTVLEPGRPDEPVACPICDGRANIVTTRQPGYQAPKEFAVAACESCGASHALPLETSVAVYELIYANADILPGYERYARYARQVRRVKDPLDFIARQEDVYWSIARYLRGRDPAAVGPVLEIGSGLGYLTFAMRRAGYDALGVDVSTRAVERARTRYGPFYEAADVIEMAARTPGRYGLIVMAETIEHVPDFYALMNAIGRLLRPGGEAIVTTPNRSFYASELAWETDPPPVHLFWFTEESLRRVARRCSLDVRFTDFSEFNRISPPPDSPAGAGVTRRSMFDERGRLILRTATLRRILPIGRIYALVARGRSRWRALRRNGRSAAGARGESRGTICAIFTRGASASSVS